MNKENKHNEETHTLSEWSEILGLSEEEVKKTMTEQKKGNKFEKLIEKYKDVIYEYENEKHSLEEWATLKKIKHGTLVSRWDKGLREEKLLQPPAYKTTMYEYDGQIHSLEEWATLKGINTLTLYKRWYKGYRGEWLFNNPKKNIT